MRQVSHPTKNVIPISMYKLNSQLWHVLRHYKDGSGPSTELLAMQASLYAPLLVRGPAHVDHNRADDLAFTVARRLHGERMLVLDDTLTTGARLQSAVSALRLNGASTVAGVAVGRVIDPDWNDNCRRIWDQARATQFSFDQCCLCRG
jgi:hypothetical protein